MKPIDLVLVGVVVLVVLIGGVWLWDVNSGTPDGQTMSTSTEHMIPASPDDTGFTPEQGDGIATSTGTKG